MKALIAFVASPPFSWYILHTSVNVLHCCTFSAIALYLPCYTPLTLHLLVFLYELVQV